MDEDELEELLSNLGQAERALEEKLASRDFWSSDAADAIYDELNMRLEEVRDKISTIENALYSLRNRR